MMYKKYEMLVYTHPDLFARFCFSKLVERKKLGLICFPRIRFPGLIYCDQEPLWLLNVIDDDCYFLGVHNKARQLDVRFFFTLKLLSLSFP